MLAFLLLACSGPSVDTGDTAGIDTGDTAATGTAVACEAAERPFDEHSGDLYWWGWLPDGVLVETVGDETEAVFSDGHTVDARWWREDPEAAGHGWNDGFLSASNDDESGRAYVVVQVASDSVTACEITLY